MILRHDIINGKSDGYDGCNIRPDHCPRILAGREEQDGTIQRHQTATGTSNRQRPAQNRIVGHKATQCGELVRTVTAGQNLQRHKEDGQGQFHPMIIKVGFRVV